MKTFVAQVTFLYHFIAKDKDDAWNVVYPQLHDSTLIPLSGLTNPVVHDIIETRTPDYDAEMEEE